MKKRRPGRPKSRPPDLKVFTALMTPKAKARLKAMAEVQGKYAYSVLEASFWESWNRLPKSTREEAEKLVADYEADLRDPSDRK